MNSQEAAEFAQFLSDLTVSLGDTEKRASWLAEMKALVAEKNQAVRLLGSPNEIERNLVDAERKKDAAESVLEQAQEEAEELLKSTEARLNQRDGNLVQREKLQTEKDEKLRNDKNAFEAECRRRRETLDAAERAVGEQGESLKQRAKEMAQREEAIGAREAEAERAMEEAERLTAGIKAVVEGQ